MDRVTIELASQRLLANLTPIDVASCPLAQATGRILAADVHADRDLPPFHRIAMDGFAVRQADLDQGQSTFPVVREHRAGDALDAHLEPGTCWRVNTGAALPEGADRVVRVEDSTTHDDGQVELKPDPAGGGAWTNVHRQGSDGKAGELVVAKGTRIGARHINALAAVGAHTLTVYRRIRVAILSTGSELVPIDVQPQPEQIRDSNGPTVAALFHDPAFTVVRVDRVADHEGDLAAAVDALLTDVDLALAIGGVSKGTRDLLPATLADAGVHVDFHGVWIRPGKPLLGGRRDNTVMLSLPGNPVSSFICARWFASQVTRRLLGMPDEVLGTATYTTDAKSPKAFTQFQLVDTTPTPQGRDASPIRSEGSGDFVSMAKADGACIIGAGEATARAGQRYPYLPLQSIWGHD